MKQYLSFVVLLASAFININSNAQCTGCTQTISTNSNVNINVNGSTRLCFTGGTFTGSISGPNGNATICIGENAIFRPQNINNWNGIIYNYGTANVNTTSMGGNAELHNFGDLTLNGINMNGSHNKIFNKEDGLLILLSSLNLSNNSSFVNDGEVRIQNDLSHSGSYTNNGITRVGGNYNPSGPLTNNGTLVVNGIANIGNGANLTNKCVSVFGSNVNSSTANFNNEGFIWVLSGTFQNSGTYRQTASAQLRVVNFTNSGNINGGGKYYISTTSTNSGWFGTDGGGINFYDATLTNPSRHFDNQTVAPHNSVTKNAFVPADTLSWSSGGSANAGEDKTICIEQITLNATGNGTWTKISGTGVIQQPTNPNTSITNLSLGNNVFKWTVPSTCGSAADEVIITRGVAFEETTWTGEESNDWHNHNNWTHCIPDTISKAIIKGASVQPKILNSKKAVAKKVEIQANGKLDITAGSSLYVNE